MQKIVKLIAISALGAVVLTGCGAETAGRIAAKQAQSGVKAKNQADKSIEQVNKLTSERKEKLDNATEQSEK